ncbi:hypothetical protein BTO06_17385 [Tenacibaculum sp. SZ-18]|nr:hypothetical protein BTO06_17385 [Tenacibaculum sp. SZ-18]
MTRIYYSYYFKNIEAALSSEPEKYEIENEIGIEIILFYEAWVSLLVLFLLLISFYILNHKKNIHWINFMILFFLTIGLRISSSYYSTVTKTFFNTCFTVFKKGFRASNLIEGLILFIVGIFIILNQYKNLKNSKYS